MKNLEHKISPASKAFPAGDPHSKAVAAGPPAAPSLKALPGCPGSAALMQHVSACLNRFSLLLVGVFFLLSLFLLFAPTWSFLVSVLLLLVLSTDPGVLLLLLLLLLLVLLLLLLLPPSSPGRPAPPPPCPLLCFHTSQGVTKAVAARMCCYLAGQVAESKWS